MHSLGISPGLITDRLEARYAFLQRRVRKVGHARFDGVIEPLEPQVRLGGALVQLRDMLAVPLGTLLAAVQDRGEHLLQPLGLEQPIFEMGGDEVVQLLHWDRPAFAAGLALPRLGGAGVVAIATALAGAQRHRPVAAGAEADAGQEGRPADDTRGRDSRIARPQMRLDGVKGCLVDDRWDLDRDHLGLGIKLPRLVAPVERMTADIGRSRQDPIDLSNAPSPAVAGEDAPGVEVGDDLLHAQRPGYAVAFQGQPIDQPDRVGVERIDLQLLLDLGAALLGLYDAVADRRESAVPEALACVLLHGAQNVLGVLLGLVFVEQGHDLTHHDMHRIVAHLLRDGEQLDAIFRQLANIELELEVVAKEAAEGMDNDHVEGRRLGRSRLDHPLELGPAVVGRRRARLDIGLDQLVAARPAVGFTLPLLIGYGDIVLGLPRRRDAQVKGGAQRRGHCRHLLVRSSARSEQFVQNVAEPGLEHVHLGVRDGDSLRPIVGDRPGTKIMLGWTTLKRPGLAEEPVKLVGRRWQTWTGRARHAAKVVDTPG